MAKQDEKSKKIKRAEDEVERLTHVLGKRREKVSRAELNLKKAKDRLTRLRKNKEPQERGAEAVPAGPGGSGL